MRKLLTILSLAAVFVFSAPQQSNAQVIGGVTSGEPRAYRWGACVWEEHNTESSVQLVWYVVEHYFAGELLFRSYFVREEECG